VQTVQATAPIKATGAEQKWRRYFVMWAGAVSLTLSISDAAGPNCHCDRNAGQNRHRTGVDEPTSFRSTTIRELRGGV